MLAQAACGRQLAPSRSMALSVMIILRMTATRMTLGFLAGGGEAVVECFEGGVVTAGAEGCHVEDVSDRHASAVDAAVSPQLAAVEIVGRETDQRGDLFALMRPSSGSRAMRVKASTGPTPGIEVRRA